MCSKESWCYTAAGDCDGYGGLKWPCPALPHHSGTALSKNGTAIAMACVFGVGFALAAAAAFVYRRRLRAALGRILHLRFLLGGELTEPISAAPDFGAFGAPSPGSSSRRGLLASSVPKP